MHNTGNIHIKELNELKVLIYGSKVTGIVAYELLLKILSRCRTRTRESANKILWCYKVDNNTLLRFNGNIYVRVKNKRLIKDIDSIIGCINKDLGLDTI